MAVPLSYNLRNLAVRKTTTLMTALGIALTVSVLLAVLALVQGLSTAFQGTGSPLDLLVLRKGSNSELTSNFTRSGFQDMKVKPGIAKNSKGEPMASLEMVTVLNLATGNGESANGNNVTLRGLLPIGIEMRDGLKLDAGRWFQQGRREVVVGKSILKLHPQAALGKTLHFGRGDWEVVGIMSAGDSAVNSEIFADLNQASGDYNRVEVVSSALVRAADRASATAFIEDIQDDQKLNMSARPLREYYEAQMVSAAPVKFLGIFVAVIMAIGSCFAAMNTMYAAVAKRAREIGTLRVLGFSKGGILTSFFIESLLLSALGGLIGIILVLPLNNMTTGIGSFTTFSEIAFNFKITPAIMLYGMLFALFMGAAGGLAPAGNAARKEILVALREI